MTTIKRIVKVPKVQKVQKVKIQSAATIQTLQYKKQITPTLMNAIVRFLVKTQHYDHRFDKLLDVTTTPEFSKFRK